jgi:bacterioferritin (cytochrome b1)
VLLRMEKLASRNPEKVVDLLCERLAFERAGVKLYDAIIAKLQRSNEPEVHRTLKTMHEHRAQEKEHEEWLEAQIRALGGDTHIETDLARLVTVESSGIEAVVMDGDNDPVHLFHALLAAELADNAGWDLLVALADECHDRIAKKEFKKRLHEEEDHLVFVRRAVASLAMHDVLGEELDMPVQP